VATWPDSSGGGHPATGVSSNTWPTYRTGIQNGKPGVQFDTVDDQLATGLTLANEPLTVFAVVRWANASGSVGSVLGHTGSEPFKRWWWGSDNNTKKMTAYKGDGTNYDPAYNLGSVAMAPGVGYLVGMRAAAGGALTFWTNGDAGVAAGTLTKTSTPRRWCWPRRISKAALTLCELVLYNTALSADDVAALRSYFNAKYALY
jgi:hypothetical protein